MAGERERLASVLRSHMTCEDDDNYTADLLEADAAELAALREFYERVKECMEDTWECEGCGRSEPWWFESNADYATRESVKCLASPRNEAKDKGEGE